MWNDEDNNPYGAFERHDEPVTASMHGSIAPPSYHTTDRPGSPLSSQSSTHEPSDYVVRAQTPDDNEHENEDEYEDEERRGSQGYKRPPGVYDSRVEQILHENPELPIFIHHAGKNSETGGNYIVYTIQTGDLEVRRRYSEFNSLRATLVSLHPTLIIPPIPEKHSVADYAARPTKAKEDASIIDLRKRMLAVFLNRCRKMKEIREDGVWWRFLDPNVSWNEVLHTHPISSIPKNNLKAPPLDPANPTPAHAYLPIPASSAKLKATPDASLPTDIAHRFPPTSRKLTEQELDPYFIGFEASTRELELLLQGNIDKVNRRTLSHLSSLSSDLMELGARYNGFSLSETSPTVAAAIERVGQAADTSYIETGELATSLGSDFSEPMRESAQFAGVVRGVLRYRVLKRIQEEMTREEINKKKALLESLEQSEQEARRIDQFLNRHGSPANKPQRSVSDPSAASNANAEATDDGRRSREETESIDSDFPIKTDVTNRPSASQGEPNHQRKTSSSSFMMNKLLGRVGHAVHGFHGFMDVDPERTRRDQIGKTRESLTQLAQAVEVSEQDVKDASAAVLHDLKRFQKDKEDDFRRYMVAYARCHLDWARKNLETWTEAKDEVDKIVIR